MVKTCFRECSQLVNYIRLLYRYNIRYLFRICYSNICNNMKYRIYIKKQLKLHLFSQ